jgi:hypothetical protein
MTAAAVHLLDPEAGPRARFGFIPVTPVSLAHCRAAVGGAIPAARARPAPEVEAP